MSQGRFYLKLPFGKPIEDAVLSCSKKERRDPELGIVDDRSVVILVLDAKQGPIDRSSIYCESV